MCLTRSENMRIPELAHHVPAAQITATTTKYRVPGECADLFVLTMLAFDRAIDRRREDQTLDHVDVLQKGWL
jgi:hypothetical protein